MALWLRWAPRILLSNKKRFAYSGVLLLEIFNFEFGLLSKIFVLFVWKKYFLANILITIKVELWGPGFEFRSRTLKYENVFFYEFSNSLHGAARSGTGHQTPSDICERHMPVTWYQIGWRSNHNVGLRMFLVVGAGGGTSQVSRDVNGSATQPELAG